MPDSVIRDPIDCSTTEQNPDQICSLRQTVIPNGVIRDPINRNMTDQGPDSIVRRD